MEHVRKHTPVITFWHLKISSPGVLLWGSVVSNASLVINTMDKSPAARVW